MHSCPMHSCAAVTHLRSHCMCLCRHGAQVARLIRPQVQLQRAVNPAPLTAQSKLCTDGIIWNPLLRLLL